LREVQLFGGAHQLTGASNGQERSQLVEFHADIVAASVAI
jgi:hypothetical protein